MGKTWLYDVSTLAPWSVSLTYMSASRSNAGSWLRGTTIRKGTTTPATRSHTPQTQTTSSSIVFSGGVKDASGRTSEYFVSAPPHATFRLPFPLTVVSSCHQVHGRSMSSVQIGQRARVITKCVSHDPLFFHLFTPWDKV